MVLASSSMHACIYMHVSPLITILSSYLLILLFHMNNIPLSPYIDLNQSSVVSDVLHIYQTGCPVILAVDVGCGKTRMALSCIQHIKNICNQAIINVLIILPATLIGQWIHEMITTQAATEDAYCVYHAKNRMYKLDEFLNQSNASIRYVLSTARTVLNDCDYLLSKRWDTMIIDEVHKLRNLKTESAAAIRQFPCNKIGLTATPAIKDGYKDLLSISYLLNERWGIANAERFGDPETLDIRYQSNFSTNELSKCVLVTRSKQEFDLRILNRKYENIYVSFTDEECDLYERALELCECKYTAFLNRKNDLNLHVDEERRQLAIKAKVEYIKSLDIVQERSITPLRRNDISAVRVPNAPLSSKLQRAVTIIEKFHSDKEPLLVFCSFEYPLQLISSHLLIPHQMVSGYCGLKTRSTSIQKFVSGECDIMLLTTRCGGVGLNLERANHCLFLSAEYNPQDEEQAIGRMDRRTQISDSITVMRLCIPGTFDCIRHTVHRAKLSHLNKALRRGYNKDDEYSFCVYNTICKSSFNYLYKVQWLNLLKNYMNMNEDILCERMYRLETLYYQSQSNVNGHRQRELRYQEENECYDTALDEAMLWNEFLEDFNH